MDDTDYYTILEIPRSASETDVKKSYRKMALKWHPDKNPDNKEEAEAKFKKISEAYEVLSDKEKRSVYDKYGKEGLADNGPSTSYNSFDSSHFTGPTFHFSFRDPQEVFREFFGKDPFADFFANTGFPGFGSSLFGPSLFSPFGDPFGDPFFIGAPSVPSTFPRPSNSGSVQSNKSSSSSSRRSRGNEARQRVQPYARPPVQMNRVSTISPISPISPIGGCSLFDSLFSPNHFEAFRSGTARAGNFTSRSSSTKLINGKTVVTTKVVENGIETVTVEENGRLKSRTVNGQPQSIQN